MNYNYRAVFYYLGVVVRANCATKTVRLNGGVKDYQRLAMRLLGSCLVAQK